MNTSVEVEIQHYRNVTVQCSHIHLWYIAQFFILCIIINFIIGGATNSSFIFSNAEKWGKLHWLHNETNIFLNIRSGGSKEWMRPLLMSFPS